MTHKTKATGGGRQWENTKHKPEHHSDFLAGGQCDQCAGLLVGYQPFGSIPRRFSSALANSLNQLPRVRPSEVAASFTCWRSSLLILIWKVGDHPSPRGDLSRFNVDMYVRNSYYHCCYVRTISVGTVKSKAPQVSLPLAGLLTTNDSKIIEVAMRNHITHPQGRDSHNLNKYIWRFIALSTAQPRVIHIEATSEQEARQQSPAGCVMVFAARIRQEVRHVQ
ncbi:TPA: host cell division inhibitor Icd-like protein [Escherichia coli]|nr:host cell division inhibitor Icd-like protein [Escherichia coli]HDZ3808704.1 host cell division inhibitor Icd-like protein [Escherichia coli]HDZ3828505.1 host cell division inhibitor Icd-like protein [Escherichia coli]HDZ3838532.1 host cell division inhibitor Icd-like protein [Escherichia coli]HDZ3845340.1 host cell division inhibitor Icd-like protein [Escherichia coli]